MENPFLTPPQVESPQSRSWGVGFIYGFQGPAMSSMTTEDVAPEDFDAFDMGVLAGQDAAINGLEFASPCVDLNREGPSLLEIGSGGFEGAAAILHSFKAPYTAGLLGMLIAVVELSMGLETHFDDPNEKLQESAVALQGQLASVGFSESMELFLGGGVDTSATGCELLLTSIHRDQSNAEAAAPALGRAEWLVVRWRSDQSGGATVVAASS